MSFDTLRNQAEANYSQVEATTMKFCFEHFHLF